MNIYTFFRGVYFYPIELKDDEDAIENAKCNPGTTKVINSITNKQVWRLYDEPIINEYKDDQIEFNDEVYTVEDFFSTQQCSDWGTGYWVKNGLKSKDEIFSTEQLDATHIVWYNK